MATSNRWLKSYDIFPNIISAFYFLNGLLGYSLREVGVQAVLSHGEVTLMRSDQEGVDAFIWTYFTSSFLVDKYTI